MREWVRLGEREMRLEGYLNEGGRDWERIFFIHHYEKIHVIADIIRDHFMYAPSQWVTTLYCNVVSHWQGSYTKWSLHNLIKVIYFYHSNQCDGWLHIMPRFYASCRMWQAYCLLWWHANTYNILWAYIFTAINCLTLYKTRKIK